MELRPVASASRLKSALQSDLTEGRMEEADMKAEFGQMPPFTAQVQAAGRLIRLSARAKGVPIVMARTTGVSLIADRAVSQIKHELDDLGYVAQTTKNRAFFTTVFTRQDDGHKFEMLGWHGTGPFAGGERAILEFYDLQKSKTRPVVSIGPVNEANVNPQRQREVVHDILKYIRRR